MNKEYIFFNRKNGIIFGIFAWVITFCSFIIAIYLYGALDPSFSILSIQLSDLGAGKNFSNVIFCIGLTFTEIFLIFFYICLGKVLQEKSNSILIKITLIASIISSISLILVVPFLTKPEDIFFNIMHVILGNLHFVSIVIAFIFYGLIEYYNPSVSNYFALISFSSGFLSGLSLILVNINIFYWFAIIGEFFWVLIHIIFLLKKVDIPSNKQLFK